ncbi:4fe-4S ferredoxin, iron-sulfur binding protein, putative [Syntrophobotulus glycolicus DSM 8271]|uniref:4fe-4S ferredoxin, iron-sulfur binding protein, putative n=1 Tax=Syntrophobotulus glycolicus (strain DSM 8271 / FlGlyR) TaxID=645991 RepID=F0T0Q4_SYNGF|nr:4Fe-4S dicluster domain-containing protein [Syntrophobotulus glycolicus]ADY56193.1 4fe-4S ferredoxin, iron-sulfur binding protein, putative [Syntrophobotulus glycolicus DSM 8271]
MLAVQAAKLKEVLHILSKDYAVLVPAKIEETSKFVPLQENTEILLSENVRFSPKDVFFPQTENMYCFKTKDKFLEIENIPEDKQPKLLFGVRSCDMKSLECLDQVFLTKGFVDQFYKEKRDNTTIIALNCVKPGQTCFCSSMSVDPQKGVNADIQAYLSGDAIGLEPRTEKGQKVLDLIKGQLAEEQIKIPDAFDFKLKVDVEGVPEKLKGMFESPLWEEVSRKCLNCGACTYICPTCHCFDISQNIRGEEGIKYRCWDSCMYGEYTQMAGGHNPRPGKKEKVRNRFMHKLSYFPERYNMLLCTGCGRCLNVCPINMDITSIMNKIKEAD